MDNQESSPQREKLTRKERRRRWKAVKKQERAALKERLRYAPALKRWWNLYFKKPVITLLVIAILVSVLYQPVMNLISDQVAKYYFATKDTLSNTRSVETVEFGDKITPVYIKGNIKNNSYENINGKQITFGRNTSLQLEPLPAGQYLSTAVITDPRGDSYYSPVISSTMERGSMQNWKEDPRFFGSDYQ